jgi:hypothetical protein
MQGTRGEQAPRDQLASMMRLVGDDVIGFVVDPFGA